MELDANFSIHKLQGGDGDKECVVEVKDKGSKQRIKVRLSLEDFSQALFGLSEVSCKMAIADPSKIGKTKELMDIRVEVPGYDLSAAKSLIQQETPNGWQAELSTSRYPSFDVGEDGKIYALTIAYRWV